MQRPQRRRLMRGMGKVGYVLSAQAGSPACLPRQLIRRLTVTLVVMVVTGGVFLACIMLGRWELAFINVVLFGVQLVLYRVQRGILLSAKVF